MITIANGRPVPAALQQQRPEWAQWQASGGGRLPETGKGQQKGAKAFGGGRLPEAEELLPDVLEYYHGRTPTL